MPVEARDLPAGYTWREIPQIGAGFPQPDGWFYKFDHVQGTDAVFITRELIRAEGFFTSAEDVKSGQGFRTGLALNTVGGISVKLGVRARVFARGSLTANPLLVPESSLETRQEESLTIFRGYFRSGSRLLADRGMPPIKYLIEAIANERTDRWYLVMFETPIELWPNDRDIAEILVGKKRLDPNY